MSSFDRNSRPARRLKRGQHLVRVWQFEQLESRAMLAVMGPTPYYGGDHGPQPHSFSESQPVAMFAPAHIERRWAGAPMEHAWGGRPMEGGFHNGRMMFREYGEIDVWYAGPPNLSHSSLTQPSPPPPTYFDPPSTMIVAASFNPYGNGVVTGAAIPPVQPNPSGTSNNQLPIIVHTNDLGNLPPEYSRGGVGDEHSYEHGAGGGLSQLAINYFSSTASQTTAREVGSSAFAWTSALDAALQSYTSQLLLSASGQVATSIKSSDQSLLNSEPADDFIHLGDSTSQDLFAASNDAIAQERADVEAVLESLKDADSLPSKLSGDEVANAIAAPQDQDGQIADLVFGSAFDLADADGGMVLLKATGDANESPINLASVAEAHPDLFSGHVGVEPSVGLYQAIDMGFEELSATENVPVAKPSAQPSQQAKPDNRYSANAGGGTTSRKSAAAFAVSAVAGGMLWVASHKNADDDDSEECSTSQLIR